MATTDLMRALLALTVLLTLPATAVADERREIRLDVQYAAWQFGDAPQHPHVTCRLRRHGRVYTGRCVVRYTDAIGEACAQHVQVGQVDYTLYGPRCHYGLEATTTNRRSLQESE